VARTVAGSVLGVGLALVVGVGALHVAMPPNETAAEGAADPFLFVRGPVVKVLDAVGLLDWTRESCLPSVSSAGTTFRVLPTGEKLPVCEQEVRREPVYRGLLLQVGRRITFRLKYFGEEWGAEWRTVRLCYAVGPRRFVAAESPSPDRQLAEVSGFVPNAARGTWVEFTDHKGDVHSLSAWGDFDPFWRD
jgi:hypothetical protein